MFNVDFKDIKFQLTPHFLRKDNLLKLMFSAIKPLKELNNNGVVVESFGQSDRINPSTTALDYDATITYSVGDFRKFQSVTFQNNTAITVPEPFDPIKWTKISDVNVSLHQFILFITNFLNFDARTIFLGKFLNDIYAKVTQRWKASQTFLIGDKVIFDGQNYIALTNSTGKQPDLSPSDWETTGIEIINDNTIRVVYVFKEAEEVDNFIMYKLWDSGFDYKINTLPVTGDFAVFENKIYQAKTDNTNKQPDLNPSDWDFISDITYLFKFSDEFPFDYQVQVPADIEAAIFSNPDLSFDRMKSQIRQLNAAGISFEGVRKADTTFQLFNSRQ